MNQPNNQLIFKKGSTTYYYSSFFFPQKMWEKVATLYAYVRVLDDFVDQIPADKHSFYRAALNTVAAWQEKKSDDPIVNNLVELAKDHQVDFAWIKAFLRSMYNDLHISKYQTYQQLEKYMFGSAAVIGLCMAKLLELPEAALPFAQKQGEAMQLINFIRDINEDLALGRQYIPQQDLEKFGLNQLVLNMESEKEISAFKSLVRFEIERYRQLQQYAEGGYKFIPYRYRIPIATAAYLYKWTADTIYQDPMIVFQRKVKPTKTQVLLTGLRMAYIWR